jgi:pSer/pThr/pTyr-binding forkhead associated (FHA) protein
MRVGLKPLDGGPVVELEKELALVGRGEDSDLRLDHKSISKLHCVLVKTDGLILIRDLGSTNGTRVNGQRVRRAALLPNDVLAFANFRFTVLFGDVFAKFQAEVLPETKHEFDGEAPVNRKAPTEPLPVHRNTLPDDYPQK